MKLCVECDNHRKIGMMNRPDSHVCVAQADQHLSPVTGKMSIADMIEKCDAEVMRMSGEPCGPEGKLWIPIVPKPPKPSWWDTLFIWNWIK